MDKTMHAGLAEAFAPSKVGTKPGRGGAPPMKYISHALVTERLNEVDPGWSSRHVATHTYLDGQGVIHCAGVTIEMTVGGVTRVEAGGPQRQDGFTNEVKNALSDALKRAAMRFGVALYLWDSLVDAEFDEDVHPEVLLTEAREIYPQIEAARRTAMDTVRAVAGADKLTVRQPAPTPLRQPLASTTPETNPFPNSAPRGCNKDVVVTYLRGAGFGAVTDFGSAIKEVNAWVGQNFPGEPLITGTGEWNAERNEHKVWPSDIYNCAAYYLAKCEPVTEPAVALAAGGVHVEDDEEVPF